MTAGQVAKGCLRTAGTTVLVIVVLGLGWFLYDTFRPRDPLETLFQQVIRDAAISNQYNEAVGWGEINVSSLICSRVDRQDLAKLGIRSEYIESYPFPMEGHLIPADIWEVSENKSIFASCSDHSIRRLSIEIQRTTDQCRAFVRSIPDCDP